MRLDCFTKTTAEIKRYVVDYAAWLDTGETISSAALVSTQTSTNPASQTTPLSIDASSNTTTEVIFFVSLGDDNAVYQVDIQVATSSGQVKEDTIQFTIRNP